jgi:membrane fusion protein (multidrug efflux system)
MNFSLPRIVLLLLGCHALLAGAAPARAPASAPAQSVAAPAPSAATAADSAQAIRVQLLPRRYTTLASEIGAKIQRLPVTEGERFREGDVLVSFDCAIQNAQLQKAQASHSAASQTWEANRRLVELNAAGKLEMNVSKAEMDKNQAEVNSSAAFVSKCRIVAPFSGRVAEQKVREQQYAQPGQPLLDIIDDGQLEVEFIVPSKWMSWLKTGLGFRVRIDETGKTYPAKIKRVGARVDPVSQSVKVLAVVDGQFNDLVAGMSGRALFNNPAAGQ